jgi:H+/Cl- antiporter ClcA
MFIGAVLGIAVSGLPGMQSAAAIGTGIGAMCCALLRLPLTSVLLATVLMGKDGLTITPQVVVAVVVSFVLTVALPTPGPPQPEQPEQPAQPAEPGTTGESREPEQPARRGSAG